MKILLFTTLVSLMFRTIYLSSYPIGFTPDEAAFGYNAYSLIHTGKDEWGVPFYKLPFTNLKSFGDYKLPLYAFLAMPFIKIIGLNEVATRLPNAIVGSFLPLAVFLLSYALNKSRRVSNLSAILAAISPWSIQLSRGAFEANLAATFIPLAVYSALKGKKLSTITFFVLSFYVYHSSRLILMPIMLILFFVKRHDKAYVKSFVITFILIVPGLFSMLGLGSARLSDLSIFSTKDNISKSANMRLDLINFGIPNNIAKIIANKWTQGTVDVISNYYKYFTPKYLFFSGPAETTYGMIPGLGVIYVVDLVGIVSIALFYKRFYSKRLILILILTIISIIPASLATGPGYAANRAAIMLPFILILTGIGLSTLIKKYPSIKKLFIIFYLLNLLYFANTYINLGPKILANGMNDGMKSLVIYSRNLEASKYEVKIDRGLSEPHIYYAFYDSIDPTLYQKATKSWPEVSSSKTRFLDQYGEGYYLNSFFYGDMFAENSVKKTTVFIGRPQNMQTLIPAKSFTNHSGEIVINIATKNPI